MQTRCVTYWPTRRSSCRRFRGSNRRSASPGCGRTSAASAAGAEHERRRALAVAEIDRLDPDELRRDARDRAAAALRDGDPLRHVPVETLAAALGLPAGLAADVAAAARAYQPHVEADIDAADGAVARLVEACGGIADELTAARIGLLVQACDATAGLVERAVAAMPEHEGATVDEILAGVLREDPPVRATRRRRRLPPVSAPRRCSRGRSSRWT